MKRRSIIISTVSALLVSTLLTGYAQHKKELPISRSEAKQIAIEQLGVSENKTSYAVVTTAGTKEDRYYVVEVLVEGVAYSYRIDGKTGDIRKLTVNDQNVDINNLPVIPANDNGEYIGKEKALAIALTDAGVTEQGLRRYDYELDYAYGQYLYDLEFTVDGTEYEYEIVAKTGEIFKKNVEHKTVKEPSAETFIGAERAKEIALDHAGVAADAAVFERVEWDLKKGSAVYDVDFRADGTEYEYDINAVTGEVITVEKEGKNKPTENNNPTPDHTEFTHLTLEEAKAIALAHSGVAAKDVRFEDADLDFERGIEVYEIEFSVGRTEYEYVINAESGEVIKAAHEYDD